MHTRIHTYISIHPSRGDNTLCKILLLNFRKIKNYYCLFLCPLEKLQWYCGVVLAETL